MFVLHTWRGVRDLCWPPALQVTWQAGGRVGRAGRVGGRQRRVLLLSHPPTLGGLVRWRGARPV